MSEPHIVSGPTSPHALSSIAWEIRRMWPKVSPYAEPYLQAMFHLESISDAYFADSGRSVVAYFLANANGWRGEHARRIKAELKGML